MSARATSFCYRYCPTHRQENIVLGTFIDLPLVSFIIGIAPWLFVGGIAAIGSLRKR